MQPVPGLEDGALAFAAYAEPDNGRLRQRAAAERGYEGVACVDDAARGVLLYTDIWRKDGVEWARAIADGLLCFTRAMQTEEGGFANFIADWEGHRQLHGPTSRPGAGPWHARAMRAMARGVAVFEDDACATAFERGLPFLEERTPYMDVLSVAVLAALEYGDASGSRAVSARALAWSERLLDSRLGAVLPDHVDGDVHLWGHLQEAALATAGVAFRRDDFIEAARASADAVLLPAVERAFRAPTTIPFEVSSTVCGLDAVTEATGDAHYREAATLSRAWFDGRNAAGRPVYDRARGRVYDGIDDGVVSENSGAESNIEGGLALLPSIRWSAPEFSSVALGLLG